MQNYSTEMEEMIKEAYTQNPTRETVNELAQRIGRTPRSVIAKLSSLGVYQKQQRGLNKRGEPVVKKAEFVAQLEDALGVELPSAEKMSKADLKRLVEAVQQ